MNKKMSLLIVNDCQLIREGYSLLFKKYSNDIEVIGVADFSHKVIESRKLILSDIVLMHLNDTPHIALKLAESILEKFFDIKIVFCAGKYSSEIIESGVQIGIRGFFLKREKIQNIIKYLYEINRGNIIYSSEIAEYVFSLFRNTGKKNYHTPKMTLKELEICRLIVKGLTSKEISDKLNLAMNTVIVHRRNILNKLCVANTAELVYYLARNNLV